MPAPSPDICQLLVRESAVELGSPRYYCQYGLFGNQMFVCHLIILRGGMLQNVNKALNIVTKHNLANSVA